MRSPIHDQHEFLSLFCKAAGVPLFDPLDRACYITRSHAYYGKPLSSAMLEWEGSPPRFCLYSGNMALIVRGKKIHPSKAETAIIILNRFLAAHPANKNQTPVIVGTLYKDRP